MRNLIATISAAAALAFASTAYAQDSVASAQGSGGSAAASQTQTQTLSVMAQAQLKLKEAGLFNGEASGYRTTATARALRRYQRANNLRVTGTLTPETRAAMGI